MEHTEVRDSPYITNFDLVPPSPTRSHNLEFDHTSPFEANFANNALTSPTFPHSPSYNGSYYNSPYSQHSELAELDFLTDFPSAPGSGINPEYETSEYDAPNSSGNGQGNSLLMFSSDTDYMSPPYSGGAGDVHRGRAGSPFDHGSPGSSAGGDDNNGATHGRHSRASSVASHHNPHLQSPSPQPQGLNYSPQPNFHPSPRLDVVNSFGNMSVHTPNWGAQSLPQGGHSPNVQSQGLPQGSQKPLSPPRLSMPPSMAFESESTAVPTINAPDEGDGHDNNGNGGLRSAGNGPGGPSFNIVPATPVSGGVSHARQGVQFQQSLGTLPQGIEIGSPEEHQQSQSQQNSRHPSPFPSPIPPSHVPTAANDYLFPNDNQELKRRNSDTWIGTTGGFGNNNSGQNQLGLSVSSYAFQQGQAQAQAQAQQNPHQLDQQHRQQLQTFTFGGGPSNSSLNNGSNNFLAASNSDSMRRSISDSLTAPPRMHGRSRSEDIRSPVPTFASPPGANNNNTGNFQSHHVQSNSIAGSTAGTASGQYLFPPTAHSDFLQRNQQQQTSSQQFLHPHDMSLGLGVPTGTRRSLSPMGHIRRASSGSGSRSGRGAEVWGTTATELEGTGGTLGTRRMSPYPTPNASPRVTYTELDELGGDLGVGLGGLGLSAAGQQGTLGSGLGPGTLGLGSMGMGGNGLGAGNMGMNLGVVGIGVSSMGADGIPGIGEPPISAGYTEEVSITGQRYLSNNGDASGHHRDDSVNSLNEDATNGAGVAKQNVTTGRTANASIRRRKQEAHFACTVPGCGSTFTRGFNLKGHMRSHYEQKPYKCHWPGCDKGFARQHDCKRHEQLHSNYRPFVCDGCGKNFARMDALNRHLRSEAGVECARAVEEKKENGGSVNGAEAMEEDDEDDKKPGMNAGGQPQPRRRNTAGLGAGSMGIGNTGLVGMEGGGGWGVAL